MFYLIYLSNSIWALGLDGLSATPSFFIKGKVHVKRHSLFLHEQLECKSNWSGERENLGHKFQDAGTIVCIDN